MELENNSQKKVGIIISTVVALGVLFVSIFLGKQPSSTQATDQTSSGSSSTSNTSIQTATSTQTKKYKDGTYSATGSYKSPGGVDQLGVTITLKKDIITNVSINQLPGDRTSARYQKMFVSGYKQLVLGKDIASVKLTKVSGSSLTAKGFNDALTKIKAQGIVI